MFLTTIRIAVVGVITFIYYDYHYYGTRCTFFLGMNTMDVYYFLFFDYNPLQLRS